MWMLLSVAVSWATPWCDAVATGLDAGTLFVAEAVTPPLLVREVHGVGPYLVIASNDAGERVTASDLQDCAARHRWPRAHDSAVMPAFLSDGVQLSYVAAGDGVITAVPEPPAGREPDLLGGLATHAADLLDEGVREGVPPEEVALLREGVGVAIACDEAFDGVCRGYAAMSTPLGCFMAAHAFAITAAGVPRLTQGIDMTCLAHRAVATITRDGGVWTAEVVVANRFVPVGSVMGVFPIRGVHERPLSEFEVGTHDPAMPEEWQEVLRHASHTGGVPSAGLQLGMDLAVRLGLPPAIVLAAAVNPGPSIRSRRVEYRGDNPYTCLGYGLLAAGHAVAKRDVGLFALLCPEPDRLRHRASVFVAINDADQVVVTFGWLGDDLGLPWADDEHSVTVTLGDAPQPERP